MILLCLGVKQEEIINKIESYEIDGKKVFKLKKKERVNHYFDTTLEDLEQGCNIIQSIVRGVKYGNVIFFSTFPIKGDEVQWFT